MIDRFRMDVTVVVPCFNEGRRLRADGFRDLFRAHRFRVLFVDDGSTDDTLAVLDSICAGHTSRAGVLRLPRNVGKAEAVRRGLLAALDQGSSIVGFLDADLATPASEMVRLCETLSQAGAEVALGARVALLGSRVERSALRHYLGRVFATAASMILKLKVYDTQCGAKAFRATPLLSAVLGSPLHARWAFDVELIGRLLAGAGGVPGLPVSAFLEMPLRTWTDVAGSKLRPSHFPMLGVELLRIFFALRRFRRHRPGTLPSPVEADATFQMDSSDAA
jgi:dolichyl-phosphate beta-glucosyltransferase